MADTGGLGTSVASDCEVMIACTTLKSEIEHVMQTKGVQRRVVWLEHQLHNVPTQLTAALQEALDEVRDADRVLLGYGNCGNAIQGLVAGDYELIVPRIDDCISIMLGSQHYRERYGRENRAFYLTDGWVGEGHTITSEYEDAIRDYGEEEADDVMQMMYAHYETMTYLDTGLYDIKALMADTRKLCEVIEVRQVVEPALFGYVEALVCGPWPDNLFVHVSPHGCVPADPFNQPGSVREG
ncbi:MAG TPA: hypothetical protein DCP91_01145 [Eggerthellaceae bacterium]|nr:hypothetical protein [Eggerthellaceae bacterium]